MRNQYDFNPGHLAPESLNSASEKNGKSAPRLKNVQCRGGSRKFHLLRFFYTGTHVRAPVEADEKNGSLLNVHYKPT